MISIISFLLFTLIVAVVSYICVKNVNEKSSEGYFLGSRQLTAPVIAGSLLLTNLSTEQIVGLNGQSFNEGILVMAWETLAAIAMVFTAIFLLPRYLKSGLFTIPQFLELRYDNVTKVITSILFLSGYTLILMPIVLYSGGLAINNMFDIPDLLGVSNFVALVICIISIGIVGSIYAIFGGLKAVAISDTVNTLGLLIGGLLIPIFGLVLIGDGSMVDGINKLWAQNPDKFSTIGSESSSIPFSTIFTGMILVQIFYWGTNQAIIQRALAAKNLKEGQKGLILASLIKILIPIIIVLPGIIAFNLFEGNLQNPDEAYPMLVKTVLPSYLLGFFAAVMFGAILSSFNSALNSSATLFGIDIYKEIINKNANDEKIIKISKIFGFFLTVLSICVAPMIAYYPKGLFGYLQEINGCYSIPILTIIIIGYLTKNVPSIAAKVALISGVSLYSISQFILKPYVFGDENYPHFLHVMAILFLLNIIIMLVIGKLFPRKEPYIHKYSKQVDIKTWKYAKLSGSIICFIVILTYIIFS